MKIWLNLEDEEPQVISDKVVACRITLDDYEQLRKQSENLSELVRRLIKAYLKQVDAERKAWIKTEGNEL